MLAPLAAVNLAIHQVNHLVNLVISGGRRQQEEGGMTDDDKARGIAIEWEPGQGAPAWLAYVLLFLVALLVGIAVWCWRLVAG